MNQTDAILLMLENGETVTPLDCLKLAGCFRLAARINELRKLGHKIETVPVRTVTGKCVAGYRLKRIVERNGQILLAV